MRYPFLTAAFVFFSMLLPMSIMAGNPTANTERKGPPTGWSTFTRGGAVYQFDSDLDEGGSYEVSRFNIQAGMGYTWDPRTSLSLGLGYSADGYSFSQSERNGIAGMNPWDTVHSLSLSLPLRYGLSDEWSAFFMPSLRSTGESGASFGDTLTGGVLAGVAYRFGDRLTIGPGLGVISQLEESASVFPILIINWKITDRLSLETGRGLAATLGPGLSLNYRASQQWKFAVGGRYEKLRFRLDENGKVAGGIGEDTAIPLFVNCTYSFNPKATISLVGGVELEGELQVEDSDGNQIAKESGDPALFGGITFSLRL
ncbi:DUF6268 family outer membrane beta-barrel protein [Desulfopila sp. IMCC35008]|uniref:DUF6268 family outer membrane beta-barrel protein n=1 Tax=Desulfopila sp. IMCC35008 TaxID=2653858 RepID=UPI0013D445F5|nr:DUF6268 family outer membrane beta-barrel protein [Desulfopila sp. IMCC35008]